MTMTAKWEATAAESLEQVQRSFRRVRPGKLLAITLGLAVITSSVATWVSITGSHHPLGLESNMLTILVAMNMALVLALSVMIGRRVFGLWKAVKAGAVGSRLQSRMVLIFTLVTIIPTFMVSVFSALFFHIAIKTWFDDRVQTAITESVAVAESYLAEHKDTIRADAVAMSGDFKRDITLLGARPKMLSSILDTQAALRNLSEAIIFSPSRVLARSELSFSLEFERLPPQVVERADEGNVVVLTDDDNKIRALVKLDDMANIYLMVGRVIDPKVLNHMIMAKGAVNQYRQLQKDISRLQIHFSLLFVLMSFLLLLSAIWYGMYVAIRMVLPIARLIHAAEKVRAGDFTAQVPETSKQDEIATLGRTFNRMTQQLEKQRQELTAANHQLDERRRFTEAVFAGVSAGVVALDRGQVVTLNNRVAAEMLQDDASQSMRGMPITALLPDTASVLAQAQAKPQSLAEMNMTVKRGTKRLNLHVRVTVERKGDEIEGFIMTFDDITELVSAQRSAAWADVARRIAHEIKNPLTPITLSAERLRKKYLDQLATDEDREAFVRYVDTISRHVKDIGQMVEEFVSFARMPTAVMAEHDLVRTVKEAIFSAQTAKPKVKYRADLKEEKLPLHYDERHIAQLLVNVLKNAAEGIETRHEQDPSAPAGEVVVRMEQDKAKLRLIIEDNGAGFPPDKISQLTEPYVTTRAKGTGLGLAIVKKHMEEHKGALVLENRPEGGARVILIFPQH